MAGALACVQSSWRCCVARNLVRGRSISYRSFHDAIPAIKQQPFVYSQEVHAPMCSIRDLPCDFPATSSSQPQAQSSSTLSKGRILLVDGSAVIFRAYYKVMAKAHHNLIPELESEADWVLTVFTAFTTILGLLDLSPSHFAVVFDHKGGFADEQRCLTFRHTMFPEYKKNRPPTPDTIYQGLDHLRPALVAMGIKVIEVPGVEADDVIATLAVSAATSEMKVRIVSPDKDFFQILSPDIRLLRMVSFGMEEFSARFGSLEPAQFVDVLSLIGDTCDNIPGKYYHTIDSRLRSITCNIAGIPGIGEKTAIELITKFGSVENLLKQRDKVTTKRALKGLLADKGEALLSKRLVALRADLPSYMLPFTMDDFIWRKVHDDGQRLFQLLKAMSSFVDGEIHVELQDRILGLWKKLETKP
ncbi:uncharacterized protein LOC9662305 isoform X2 [Selaginella moellendorffii]|uniref:uncharacterized protein LOC9662305 isoform X2 n=1 Tax=Selaginella moellendorffii TaxID=88036 RepID=UPI000D1CB972|nr:uncharacterized protein LOC9662305 isoform X2 [Selaginella moellendorffii]|eukprot:XP_024543575.1 uncharacterized protein LOC9662305 isoform X2 [Selaginella moellendorffii]